MYLRCLWNDLFIEKGKEVSYSHETTRICMGLRLVCGTTPCLLIQPYFLHSPVVVQRVVRHQVLHVRPLREVLVAPAQHGARDIGFQPALDLPHDLLTLLAVELL